MSKTAVKKGSAYAGLGDVLAGGFDPTLASDAADILVNLDDIEIRAQDREEFEDVHNSLAELGASLRRQQLQAILLRPNDSPEGKRYILVAGERRVRAARLVGLSELRALVRPMTDDEAETAQFEENIHRKNLTLQEEARRIKRDLAQLGSVEAVMAKYDKGRSWLSKILALLDLPEQTQRLVSENVTADLEVITTVRTVEKADPKAAAALVDKLKAERGTVNAREEAAAVKAVVKPSPKAKAAAKVQARKKSRDKAEAKANATEDQKGVFAGAKISSPQGPVDVNAALQAAYQNMAEFGSHPAMLADLLRDADPIGATAKWLRAYFDQGRKAPKGRSPATGVLQGLAAGDFAAEGVKSFALAAFVRGMTAGIRGERFTVGAVFADVAASLPR